MELTPDRKLIGNIPIGGQSPLVQQAEFHGPSPLNWRSAIGLNYLSEGKFYGFMPLRCPVDFEFGCKRHH